MKRHKAKKGEPKRQTSIIFRVTDREREDLMAFAQEHNLTMSDCLRLGLHALEENAEEYIPKDY